MTPATLKGYRILIQRSSFCPAITDEIETDRSMAEHTVNGLVIFGLTHAQVGALDRSETGLFYRQGLQVEIEVIGPDGREKQSEAVDAYIWARGMEKLEQKDWSIDGFLAALQDWGTS